MPPWGADFFCKAVGLGDPKKWGQEYRFRQYQNPYDHRHINGTAQGRNNMRVNSAGYYGSQHPHNIARYPGGLSAHEYQRHPQCLSGHLMALGATHEGLRRIGFDEQLQRVIQSSNNDLHHWTTSEVKQYLHSHDIQLMEFLQSMRYGNRHAPRLSDIVTANQGRALIAAYKSHKRARGGMRHDYGSLPYDDRDWRHSQHRGRSRQKRIIVYPPSSSSYSSNPSYGHDHRDETQRSYYRIRPQYDDYPGYSDGGYSSSHSNRSGRGHRHSPNQYYNDRHRRYDVGDDDEEEYFVVD